MNLTPLGDRLIIRPIEEDDERPSGLVIPENAKTKTQRGEVLAAGPGRLSDEGERIPQDVAVGDEVIYAPYSGQAVERFGDDTIVLTARDVLCRVAA